MTRQDALERYAALPVPDTTMEPWRFTDLSGFDPDAFTAAPNGASALVLKADAATELLDIAVAGVARVTEAGIEVERAPEGVVFEPLTADAERLGTLVGADDKFTAHNAARWQHGLLVRVPRGV